jgi:F0F1-type ATP synthase membrane subunit c/vacuolar-type H+-ATPase subunit K
MPKPSNNTSSTFGSALAYGGGLGLGSSIGNAGGVTVCNAANQNTSYCQFVQFFNIFKIFLVYIAIITFVVYLFYWFTGSKRSGKMSGGCGCSGKSW